MKSTNTLLFVLLLIFNQGICQNQLVWERFEVTPGSQSNMARQSAVDVAGNTFFIDNIQDGLNFTISDLFIKYDTYGNKVFQYGNDSCFFDCNEYYQFILPDNIGGATFIGVDDSIGLNIRLIIKHIDANGTLTWQNEYSPGYYITPTSAMLDNNNDIVVAFTAEQNSNDLDDYSFAKFQNGNGNLIWDLVIPDGGTSGISLYENVIDMDIDQNNNIHACGNGSNVLSGIVNFYYLKINSTGSLSQKTLLNFGNVTANVNKIKVESNDVYVIGTFNGDAKIERLNASSGLSQNSLAIPIDTSISSAIDLTLMNNELYFLNNFNYFIPDSSFAGGYYTNKNITISKLTSSLNLIWTKKYLENYDQLAPQTGRGSAYQIINCDNNLFVSSWSPFDSLRDDYLLTKIDSAGTLIWNNVKIDYSFFQGDDFQNIAVDSNCNFYAVRNQLDNIGYYGTQVEKYFDVVITNIVESKNSASLNIFPNPTQGLVNIDLFDEKIIDVQIYDLIGKNYQVKFNDNTLDLTLLPSSVYVLQVKNDKGDYFARVIKQ